ncbi:MAG: Holliday junction resolvase RuvX [bacterium]|nr:Holliday junction resolvase RuvX [bacterium]
MKYLGIDYGAKRVGIAMSDDSGSIAFPKTTFPNNAALLKTLAELIRKEHVGAVVMGDSKDKDGTNNTIMADAKLFAERLKQAAGIELYFEPEYYSSVEARRDSDASQVDDKAAAIILSRHLERVKYHGHLP